MDDVQHVGVYIARPVAEVYEFASEPRNLSRWAAGLARSEVRPDGDAWVTDAPFGMVRVKFAGRNALGVLDHDVTLASGVTVRNPMRVMPRGQGSEPGAPVILRLARPHRTQRRRRSQRDAAVVPGLATQRRTRASASVCCSRSR